jgi:glutamate racemase
MLGSAELVELAEAKLHGEPVPLEELRRILRPSAPESISRVPSGRTRCSSSCKRGKWVQPSTTVSGGCTHFPLLQEELQRVLPEGTRLIDSGAAIARRTEVVPFLPSTPCRMLYSRRWTSHPALHALTARRCDGQSPRRILRPWLRMQEPPDTVVLGCTHFPLLQEELQRVLPL